MLWFIITAGALAAIWFRWRRSKLGWWDFFLLHGARVYSHLWHRWSSSGRLGLPPSGPALLIANHTCSADPAFLLAACTRPVSFLVSREHYDVHPLLRQILDHLDCVPVTRNGHDPLALRLALRRLERGGVVCLFPEGNLSGVPRGRVLRPKHGIGYLALRTKAPVYVACIVGGPRTHKLVQSWLMPTPKAVRVHFKGPVHLAGSIDQPTNRQTVERITDLLMRQIEELAKVTKPSLSLSAPTT